MTVGSRLYLASRSPRRRELLARLGCLFEVLDPDVPERRAPGESPADYVQRVAAAKAEAGWNSLGASAAGAWVLGADTEVVLDDVVFGKPADAGQALAMLRRLSGREHTVLSALCLRGATGAHGVLVESSVRFASLDDATLRDYVAGLAECFVTRLCGSYSGVIGLPLAQTAALLRAAGLLPKSSS